MRTLAALLALLPLAAAALEPGDYARGIELHAARGASGIQPVQELLLPDAAYAGAAWADLSDLRVFNAAGVPVPHALCQAGIDEPLRWIAARALPARTGGFEFDAARQAPVTLARIGLPGANMSLRVNLHSRGAESARWHEVWSGEVFAIGAGDSARRSADIGLGMNTDRWWRIEPRREAESLGGQLPTLQLGYAPGRLRFLAQGNGPWLLAWGSTRALRYPGKGCDSLLPNLKPSELNGMVGMAEPGPARELGGDAALKAGAGTPQMRRLALWILLAGGAAIIAAMSLRLLQKLRSQDR